MRLEAFFFAPGQPLVAHPFLDLIFDPKEIVIMKGYHKRVCGRCGNPSSSEFMDAGDARVTRPVTSSTTRLSISTYASCRFPSALTNDSWLTFVVPSEFNMFDRRLFEDELVASILIFLEPSLDPCADEFIPDRFEAWLLNLLSRDEFWYELITVVTACLKKTRSTGIDVATMAMEDSAADQITVLVASSVYVSQGHRSACYITYMRDLVWSVTLHIDLEESRSLLLFDLVSRAYMVRDGLAYNTPRLMAMQTPIFSAGRICKFQMIFHGMRAREMSMIADHTRHRVSTTCRRITKALLTSLKSSIDDRRMLVHTCTRYDIHKSLSQRLAKDPRQDAGRYREYQKSSHGKAHVRLDPSFSQTKQRHPERYLAEGDGSRGYGESGCAKISDGLEMAEVNWCKGVRSSVSHASLV